MLDCHILETMSDSRAVCKQSNGKPEKVCQQTDLVQRCFNVPIGEAAQTLRTATLLSAQSKSRSEGYAVNKILYEMAFIVQAGDTAVSNPQNQPCK